MYTDDQLEQLAVDLLNLDQLTIGASTGFVSEVVENIRTLQQQNAQMKEALVRIRDLDSGTFESDYYKMQEIAERVLKSIQGGSSNDSADS